jgi:hypothetical protein
MMFQRNDQKASSMISNLAQNQLNSKWILDSGVTDHMTENKILLKNYKIFETK